MKKRFFTVSNLLLSSLITMLGFGSCKTASTEKASEFKEVYGPPPVYPVDTVRVVTVKQPEPLKVVYGPPPSYRWENVRPDAQGVYDVAEIMPEFKGGGAALLKWVNDNMKYPEQARKNNIEGRVIVSCIIRADGTVDGVYIVKSVDPLLDAEALRLARQMPKWQPGRIKGEAVAVRYVIPIVFGNR